jgi:uncharacterized membrane protein
VAGLSTWSTLIKIANMETKTLSFIKAITYRILGSIFTFLVSFFITKKTGTSIGIAILDFFAKILLYYFHERVWVRVIKLYEKPAKKS